jgi:hypothetical protein
VLTFNLAWQSPAVTQSVEQLLNLFMLLPNTLDPYATLFKRRTSQARDELYFFKGLVCFVAQHYYAYFRDLEDSGSSWHLCDDRTVKKAGDSWADLVGQSLLPAHAKPVMLFYERLETAEARQRAATQHFMNATISAATFSALRAKARGID